MPAPLLLVAAQYSLLHTSSIPASMVLSADMQLAHLRLDKRSESE
jgi:hypothetical protein